MESFLKVFLLGFLLTYTEGMGMSSIIELDVAVKAKMVSQIVVQGRADAVIYESMRSSCQANLMAMCSDCSGGASLMGKKSENTEMVEERSEKRLVAASIAVALRVLFDPLQAVKLFANLVVNTVLTIVRIIGAAAVAILEAVVDSVSFILNLLANAAKRIVNLAIDAIMDIAEDLLCLVKALGRTLSNLVSDLLLTVAAAVMAVLNLLVNLGATVLAAVEAILSLVSGVLSLVGDILSPPLLGSTTVVVAETEVDLDGACGAGTRAKLIRVKNRAQSACAAYGHIMRRNRVITSVTSSAITYNVGCQTLTIPNSWVGFELMSASNIAAAIVAQSVFSIAL